MITSEQLMSISFPRHYRHPSLCTSTVPIRLLWRRSQPYMDNNNTVIFLLHVTFEIIYHGEISLTFRTNYFCFQPTSMLQLTWFSLICLHIVHIIIIHIGTQMVNWLHSQAKTLTPTQVTIGLPGLSVGCQTRQTLLFSPEIVMAHTECLVIKKTL